MLELRVWSTRAYVAFFCRNPPEHRPQVPADSMWVPPQTMHRDGLDFLLRLLGVVPVFERGVREMIFGNVQVIILRVGKTRK